MTVFNCHRFYSLIVYNTSLVPEFLILSQQIVILDQCQNGVSE